MTPIEFDIPIRVANRLNKQHSGWARSRERKAHREAVVFTMRTKIHGRSGLKLLMPLAVTLTKITPRGRPLDSDGLQSALKTVRDSVAEVIGVDDGNSGYIWRYAQEFGREHGVRVRIEREAVTPEKRDER